MNGPMCSVLARSCVKFLRAPALHWVNPRRDPPHGSEGRPDRCPEPARCFRGRAELVELRKAAWPRSPPAPAERGRRWRGACQPIWRVYKSDSARPSWPGSRRRGATEERKRRLLSVALLASLLVTATVITGGWTYLAQKRAERLLATTRLVNDALSKGEQLLGQARSARPIDFTIWSHAMAAATRARDLFEQGEPNADLRARIQTMIAVVKAEQAVASQRVMELVRDRELLADLEAIRARRSEHWEINRTDEEYAAAFRNFGIDLDHLEPTEAGKRIAGRSDPAQLVSYVDDWAMRRRSGRNQGPTSWRRLLATATVADRDPWRPNCGIELSPTIVQRYGVWPPLSRRWRLSLSGAASCSPRL